MRTKAGAAFLAAAAVLVIPVLAFASDLTVPSELQTLKQGFSYVYDEKYEEAEKIFSAYIAKYPERPDGYFFMAGRWAEYINAYQQREALSEFNRWAGLTIKKGEAYIKAHPGDPAGYFYVGNVYGYMGLLEAQDQKLVSAFMSAVKAKGALEKALEIDPRLDDAYFGLGTLYYYASKKYVEEGGMVGWVVKKFITHDRDMRAEGISMLRRALSSGGITADSAFGSLMWVLLTEGEYDEARQMAQEMAVRWPGDKHGYWAMGRIDLQRRQCKSAKDNFTTVEQIASRQRIGGGKFPEVDFALRLCELCMNYNGRPTHEITAEIRALKRQLSMNPNIHLEYANSKGVLRDWREMLNRMGKRTYLEESH